MSRPAGSKIESVGMACSKSSPPHRRTDHARATAQFCARRSHPHAMSSRSSGGAVQIRLAELVAALSLGIDLGFGQPMEHVLRQCLIATRIAELYGLGDDGRACVYWTALLVNVGC